MFNRFRCIPQVLNQLTSAYNIPSRYAAHWNKDFLPGPYPHTEVLRIAAAIKYNMLREDYKPFPDNGLYYGDYPDLEAGPNNLGIEAKDEFYPYDYPELKRNFEEPVHAEVDIYGETRWSQPEKPRLKNWQYWSSFLGVMAGCLLFYSIVEDMKLFRPVLLKQYHGEGVIHYTFEPKESTA